MVCAVLLSLRCCCSGGRDRVDGVDREGALLRLRAEEGQRCAPFLRFDACAGEIRLFLYDFIPSVLLRILDPANEICNISLFSPPEFILSFRPYSESRIISAPPATKFS
jgi:hypothetical protein